jgi:hypothetical protein
MAMLVQCQLVDVPSLQHLAPERSKHCLHAIANLLGMHQRFWLIIRFDQWLCEASGGCIVLFQN